MAKARRRPLSAGPGNNSTSLAMPRRTSAGSSGFSSQEQRRGHVPQSLELRQRIAQLVDHAVLAMGTEFVRLRIDRLDQVGYVESRPPPRFPVVEHDGDDERQLAAGQQLTPFDELLEEQRVIPHHPDRHIAVGRRLELQQETDVDRPAVVEPKLPDHVTLAGLQAVGDIGGVHPLQGAEVEPFGPGLFEEAADQLFDEARLGEQATVTEVLESHNGGRIYRRFTARRCARSAQREN